MDNCVADKSKCKVVAQDYMRFGILTSIDIQAESKLLLLRNIIIQKFDHYNAKKSSIDNIGSRRKTKSISGSEFELDMISLQYMATKHDEDNKPKTAAPGTVNAPVFVDKRENPMGNTWQTWFKDTYGRDAIVPSLLIASKSDNMTDNEKDSSELLSKPITWGRYTNCPIAFFFGSTGTSSLQIRDDNATKETCTLVGKTCCAYSDISRMKSMMLNNIEIFVKKAQKNVLYMRELFKLTDLVNNYPKNSLLKPKIDACYKNDECGQV